MILVLAGEGDAMARSLVSQWSGHDARLLVPKDLSVVGWRHRAGSRGDSTAMVDGNPIAGEKIRGVLVRTPGVASADLPHIRGEDREYVAAEMTAFLLAWLSSLDCPVINRPTPYCLLGPSLRPEQWLHLAAVEGVPVAGLRRTTAGDAAPPALASTAVVVVGDRCLGATTDALDDRARRVAHAAGVSLLQAYFTGPPEDPVLTGADLFVDVQDPEVNAAVLELLVGEVLR